MQGLWEEIRRRNLHRVTAAYAVVAWVLVQGAGIVFPAFDLPGWTLRLLIVLLIAGLPILWTGLWLAHPAPPASGAAAPLAPLNRGEMILIGLLGLVLVATLAELVAPRFAGSVSTNSAQTAGPQDASIAVLAFNNMSDDAKNEYFSDGISEELLNDLAQVPGLRVAARTSSFAFKGKSENIEDIGKALNVRTVLEGSVRREGNRVRITAQLINAADGYHIWSQTYDREIADIFAVQDEISRAITRELTGRLLGTKASGTPAPVRAQINPDAYTAYLQGRFFMAKRNAPDMLRAIDFFKQAIALEPNYADAHASLGRTYALLYGNGQRRDTAQSAADEIATALRLDPGNFQALLTKALIAGFGWNWTEADANFRRVIALNPNDADAQHFYSEFLLSLDLPEAAFAPAQRAAALDPLAPIMRSSLGDVLHAMNRNAEAAAEYQATLTLDPDFFFALVGLCAMNSDLGKIDEAKKILHDRLIPIDGEDGPMTDACRDSIALRTGDMRELNRLAGMTAHFYDRGDLTAGSVAWSYALAGDADMTIHWSEKAYDERDYSFIIFIVDPDFPAKIKADPRWQTLMQRPAFQERARLRQEIIARGAGG